MTEPSLTRLEAAALDEADRLRGMLAAAQRESAEHKGAASLLANQLGEARERIDAIDRERNAVVKTLRRERDDARQDLACEREWRHLAERDLTALRGAVAAITGDIETREAIENCRCGREHGPVPPHSDSPGVAARLRAALDTGEADHG